MTSRLNRRTLLRIAGALGLASTSVSTVAGSGTAAARAIRTPRATEVGVLRQNPLIVGRDGVTSARFGDRVYWLFGDTNLTVPGEDGPYTTNFHWATNSMSWTGDVDASDGVGLDGDKLDSTGAPTEIMPLTDQERAYNLAHKPGSSGGCDEEPCGLEFALWPGVMVPDPASGRILVFYGKVHRGGGVPGGFQAVGTGIAVWNVEPGEVTRPVVRPGDPEPTLMWRSTETTYKWGVTVRDIFYAYGVLGLDNFVARVRLDSMTDLAAWRYFAGSRSGRPVWSTDPAAAVPVMSGSPGGSVSFVPYLQSYLTVYRAASGSQAVYRTAPDPWGPWSDERLYCPLRPGTNRAVYGRPEYASRDGRVQYLVYYNEVADPLTIEVPIVRIELNRTMRG